MHDIVFTVTGNCFRNRLYEWDRIFINPLSILCRLLSWLCEILFSYLWNAS